MCYGKNKRVEVCKYLFPEGNNIMMDFLGLESVRGSVVIGFPDESITASTSVGFGKSEAS